MAIPIFCGSPEIDMCSLTLFDFKGQNSFQATHFYRPGFWAPSITSFIQYAAMQVFDLSIEHIPGSVLGCMILLGIFLSLDMDQLLFARGEAWPIGCNNAN